LSNLFGSDCCRVCVSLSRSRSRCLCLSSICLAGSPCLSLTVLPSVALALCVAGVCLFPSVTLCLSRAVIHRVITKCGHIFCRPCLLHYQSLSDRSWSRCPLCSNSVYSAAVKTLDFHFGRKCKNEMRKEGAKGERVCMSCCCEELRVSFRDEFCVTEREMGPETEIEGDERELEIDNTAGPRRGGVARTLTLAVLSLFRSIPVRLPVSVCLSLVLSTSLSVSVSSLFLSLSLSMSLSMPLSVSVCVSLSLCPAEG